MLIVFAREHPRLTTPVTRAQPDSTLWTNWLRHLSTHGHGHTVKGPTAFPPSPRDGDRLAASVLRHTADERQTTLFEKPKKKKKKEKQKKKKGKKKKKEKKKKKKKKIKKKKKKKKKKRKKKKKKK